MWECAAVNLSEFCAWYIQISWHSVVVVVFCLFVCFCWSYVSTYKQNSACICVSMYNMYNKTQPNQPLEGQPLSPRFSEDHLFGPSHTHTTDRSILYAWDLLCSVLPWNCDSLQNPVCLLCHPDLSAPVYLSPTVSFLWYTLIRPLFCPAVPPPSSVALPVSIHLGLNVLSHQPIHIHTFPSTFHFHFKLFSSLVPFLSLLVGHFLLGQSGLLHNCTGQMNRSCFIIRIRHSHKVGYNGPLLPYSK